MARDLDIEGWRQADHLGRDQGKPIRTRDGAVRAEEKEYCFALWTSESRQSVARPCQYCKAAENEFLRCRFFSPKSRQLGNGRNHRQGLRYFVDELLGETVPIVTSCLAFRNHSSCTFVASRQLNIRDVLGWCLKMGLVSSPSTSDGIAMRETKMW